MITPCGAPGHKSLVADKRFMVSHAQDGHYSASALLRPLSWNKESEGP